MPQRMTRSSDNSGLRKHPAPFETFLEKSALNLSFQLLQNQHMYMSLTQSLCSLTSHFPNYCLPAGSKTAFLIPTAPSSPKSHVSHLLPEPAGVPADGRPGASEQPAGTGTAPREREVEVGEGKALPRLFCLSPPSPRPARRDRKSVV